MVDDIQFKIIVTIVVIFALTIIRFFINHQVNRAFKKFHFSLTRRRVTIKLFNFFLVIGAIVGLIAIWGIDKQKMLLFLSSVVTVLGIAFFAQWSILSNITAGLILFFNHPLRLGDTLKILEKDFIVEGKIDDITFFFLHLKTTNGEKITIPNSVLLQKTISIIHHEEKEGV
jgi:small-conductance mechanosensitive channel